MTLLNKLWTENRSFLLFILLMFMFRSAVADWNEVPTGSMKPSIIEGDRILVNKLAYDLKVPFTQISLLQLAEPERGDIVIFDSAVSDVRLVKRVVGIPGDTVAMKDKQLIINGEPLNYFQEQIDEGSIIFTEDLMGTHHPIRTSFYNSNYANFDSIEIPEDFYFVMGDNRDNSADSRVIGLIPRKEIVGRAKRVVLSFNYDNYYIPRANRWFKPI